MAFPYIYEANFEGGGVAEFDSETDANAVLNVRHYTQLVRHGGIREVPYAGTYAMHIDLTGADANQYVQEDDGFDIASEVTRFVRFYVFTRGLVMATSDRFTLFTIQSGAGTDEVTVGIVNNAGTIEFVFAETGATALGAGTRQTPVIDGQWHCIELEILVDTDGDADGTIIGYVDGRQVGAQITGLTQAVTTQARLGAIGVDAGTTAGHLLFDQVVFDDTNRVGTLPRFPMLRVLTKTGHAFVGPGQIHEVFLEDGGSNNTTLQMYDSDRADTLRPLVIPPLSATTVISQRIEIPDSLGYYNQGTYVVLGGTNPRAWVSVRHGSDLSRGGALNVAARP